MTRLLVIWTVAELLCVSTLHSRAQRDFSGEWVLVAERSRFSTSKGVAYAEAFGAEFTVKQDPGALIVTTYHRAPSVTKVYRLDGTETAFLDESRGKPEQVTLRAQWEGEALVLFDSGTVNGVSSTLRTELRLDAEGLLVVDQSAIVGGKTMDNGARSVYRKVGSGGGAIGIAPARHVPEDGAVRTSHAAARRGLHSSGRIKAPVCRTIVAKRATR